MYNLSWHINSKRGNKKIYVNKLKREIDSGGTPRKGWCKIILGLYGAAINDGLQ